MADSAVAIRTPTAPTSPPSETGRLAVERGGSLRFKVKLLPHRVLTHTLIIHARSSPGSIRRSNFFSLFRSCLLHFCCVHEWAGNTLATIQQLIFYGTEDIPGAGVFAKPVPHFSVSRKLRWSHQSTTACSCIGKGLFIADALFYLALNIFFGTRIYFEATEANCKHSPLRESFLKRPPRLSGLLMIIMRPGMKSYRTREKVRTSKRFVDWFESV